MWLVGEGDLLLIGSAAGRVESRLPQHRRAIPKGIGAGTAGRCRVSRRTPRRSCCSRCLRAEPTSWPLSASAPGCKPTIGCRSNSRRPGRMYAPPEGNAARLRALAAQRCPCGRGGESAKRWCSRLDGARQRSTAGQSVRDGARKFSTSPGSRQPISGCVARLLRCRGPGAHASPGNRMAEDDGQSRARQRGGPRGVVSCPCGAWQHRGSDCRRQGSRAHRSGARGADGAAGLDHSPTPATRVRLTPIADELVRRFPAREDGRYYQAAALFLAGRATDAESPIRALLSCEPAPRERTEPARGCVRVAWKTRVCPGGVRRRAETESSRPVRVRESRLFASRARRPAGGRRVLRRSAGDRHHLRGGETGPPARGRGLAPAIAYLGNLPNSPCQSAP